MKKPSVAFKTFESQTKSWDALFKEASDFATEVGRENLINITVDTMGGAEWTGVFSVGQVVVWYWEDR